MDEQLRFMVIGAHQDDCELVGGICLKLMKNGHRVRFLTATNGCSGHQTQMGPAIAARRAAEAAGVSKITGVEYEILNNDDGFLTTRLEPRHMMLRAIRRYAPHFIFTHRPNDYHPDHRATSVLVQDCSYLVQVPNVCADTPVLRYMPIIAYMPDSFQKPAPFQPTAMIDIDGVIEEKMRMYHQYASQFYEWLPWVGGYANEVPENDGDRFAWLMQSERCLRFADLANRFRTQLTLRYGEAGSRVRYAEGFELCEYGGKADGRLLAKLFPF